MSKHPSAPPGLRSNLGQNSSKSVKCPAAPSVKPHRPVKPDRPSGPSTGTHPQPNPLDERLGVEQLGGDPLAPVIGGLLRDRVELCIEGEVQRSGAEKDAAVNAVGLAQRALRQSPAARQALRQTRQMPVKTRTARGPILPPCFMPCLALSSFHMPISAHTLRTTHTSSRLCRLSHTRDATRSRASAFRIAWRLQDHAPTLCCLGLCPDSLSQTHNTSSSRSRRHTLLKYYRPKSRTLGAPVTRAPEERRFVRDHSTEHRHRQCERA